MSSSPSSLARSRNARSRRLGEIDAADLITGLILLVALPALTYWGLAAAGVGETKVEVPKTIDAPPPDKEEVEMRLQYIRRMYAETAKPFIDRARSLGGDVRQIDYLQWANSSLRRVLAFITDLEHLISSSGDPSQNSATLQQLASLKQATRGDLGEIARLDKLGVTGASR